MAFVIIILIIVGIIIWQKKKDEKWYDSLSDLDKTKIKELDLKLSEINSKVKSMMPKKYKLYKELYSLSKNIVKDEEIVFFTSTNLITAVAIGNNVTNKIVKSYVYVTNKKILISNPKSSKTIPLEKISSMETGKTIRNNWIKINDNSTTIMLNNIPANDEIKLKEEINKGMEKHKNISINITQKTEKDIADKIARLQVLYEEGVLTEYEFNMKKLELLDKIT